MPGSNSKDSIPEFTETFRDFGSSFCRSSQYSRLLHGTRSQNPSCDPLPGWHFFLFQIAIQRFLDQSSFVFDKEGDVSDGTETQNNN